MKKDQAIHNELKRLATVVSSMPPIVDGVMDHVRQMPTPIQRRFSSRRIAAVACTAAAACLMVMTGIWIAAGDHEPVDIVSTSHGESTSLHANFDPAAKESTQRPAGDEKPASPSFSVAFSHSDLAYVNSRWGFIDRTGKVVVETEYSQVDDFSEGMAAVKVGGTHSIGGKYGFIDRTGRMVIAPRFEKAKHFREGRAAVLLDGKWGFINREGKICVAPRYEWVWDFSEGLAAFREEKKCGFVNRQGEVVIEPTYHSVWHGFREGLAPVAVAQKAVDGQTEKPPYGYIDTTGKVVIEPRFERASQFSEGLAAVQIGERWGFVDRDGEVVIQAQYVRRVSVDGVLEFRDGLSKVQVHSKGDKFGLIDKAGLIVVEPRYMYDYGVRYSEKDNVVKGLYCDPATNESVTTEFDASRAHNTSEGLTKVWSGTEKEMPVAGAVKYGFVDHGCNVVIKPRFEEVGDFSEGLTKFGVGLDWESVNKLLEAGRKGVITYW